jgi:putative methyltransferase
MKLYFFQCQESYGNSIYLPYSSGILWTYARQFDDVKNNYSLSDIFFEKLPVKDYESKVVDPDVLLFSNYGWNTTYHLEIAKRFKQLYPNVVIVIGGPNAQQQESYLREHHYINYTVWGEGEQSLVELLTALANKSDMKNVPGIAYIDNDQYIKTTTRIRKTDLKELPSPYLEGMFDDYFTRYPLYNFMPVWETHRGCPYHCTFCDLGADYYNKVYMFETDRLLKEIDWFSEHKIEYVEVADANFGIFPRDLDLVKYIKQKHSENGFPEKINATWAKNSPERLFEMSKILDSMNRGGVTLALQSQNKTALGNIKRINIANDKLEDIAQKYIELGIPTYHDFILGLPGETLESWIEGISYVIDINPEGWIFGHPLEAYENTEFSDVNYIKKHDIKFAYTPQVTFFAHRNKDLPLEIGKYVISHSTMSNEDYIEGFLFKYFMITMHSLGWAHTVAENISKDLNIGRSQIYKKFYEYIKLSDNIINTEYEITKKSLKNTINNGDFWGRQIFGNNDFYWEYESASAIIFENNRTEYFNTLKRFIIDIYGSEYVKYIELNDHNLICYRRQYPYTTKEFTVNGPMFNSFQDFSKAIYHRGRRTKQWKTKLTATLSGAN